MRFDFTVVLFCSDRARRVFGKVLSPKQPGCQRVL